MTPCRYCVAPKRTPGCKNSCPEWLVWQKADLERKETIRQNRAKEITHQKRYRNYKPGMV